MEEKKATYQRIVDYSANLMDKHFPKGECKERGEALVFNAELITYVMGELDRAREEVEKKFMEKYKKREEEMNVPYSEEDGQEFWQGYQEGYHQGLHDMIIDTYYFDEEFQSKLSNK